MVEDKEAVILSQKEIIELEEIVIDKDKDSALEFLIKNVYEPIIKNKKNRMQSHI